MTQGVRNTQNRVIIIGASSGIGRALAELMAHNGYCVGIAAPEKELLISLQKKIHTKTYMEVIDVRNHEAQTQLSSLINRMGGVDIIIISAGVGNQNPDLDFEIDRQTIEVNVLGFCAMATTGMHYFLQQKQGQLVAISSIAGIRGNDTAPAYNASKAFISNYVQGLRKKVARARLPITITDIIPGFIDTKMQKTYSRKPFWMISAQEAATYIFQGIIKKKKIVYVSPRWRLIAWALRLAPDWLYYLFD